MISGKSYAHRDGGIEGVDHRVFYHVGGFSVLFCHHQQFIHQFLFMSYSRVVV